METAAHASPQIAARVAAARAVLAGLGVVPELLDTGAEAAEAAGALAQDEDLAVATLLHWTHLGAAARPAGAVDAGTPPPLTPRVLQERLGAQALELAGELERLGVLQLPAGWSAGQALSATQAEVLRKMLLAVAADPRLVVARMAEQLVQLRHARELPPAEQQRLAWQTRAILAPLANRLGVWGLKWELEDLAFRYLEPDDYRRIARALAEKRIDRERYIESLCARIRQELQAAGITAVAVYGRPKHIYSIWNKMQRKQLAFEQLFDVRAVRIVVETVADCYAALGVVHGLWHYIPGEFDDYIATPKDNDYRSIHTAVTGPEDKPVEIQIRSREMHEHAELGVAAHWRYKEGGVRDAGYERKIEWARRVLDPAQAAPAEDDLIERLKREVFSDRIYALTPHGDVLDLPRGATPLDFAYHLHTDLGHRCRGAKVNGRIAPLTQPLANGDVVEIISGRQGGPSRDWLSTEQGFLASPRSRAKVRAWFRRIDAAGHTVTPAAAAAAAGAGSTTVTGNGSGSQSATTPAPRRRPRRSGAAHASPVEVEGVGDLPVTIARCCGAVPPEPISGYVTLGRGVTVHRSHCPNLLRMRARNPERVLNVEWNRDADSPLPVRIRVQALDRRGLLRDVSDVMALEKLSIDGVNSNTDPADRVATIVMRTAVRDSEQLGRVLQRLGAVPNVLSAQRLA
jgi:GTP pyrophosphokinase